jgi:serine/threonine protein kinase
MARKRIFGLDPKKLDRILSIGTEYPAVADIEDRKSSTSEDAPAKEIDALGPTVSLGMLAEQPGSKIGRYQLLNVLGEGGMGIVYLAQQKAPLKRQVALKVIKPGMDSKRVMARFEAERQALAVLDHPNIAHVHDAGTTDNGRPYFVMEYVKGLCITEHCDRHKFTIEDRLSLFRQICIAVHHAHQKGIIHRDIKPSNILVSPQDDKATPKIIDFGVAKALAQPLTEQTLVTELGQLFGTPEYMSPEQADMAIEDIDTRSDIYSLGVLLYELLTGALPFDSDTLREGGIDHIRKIICETDPNTPSTRLPKLGEEANKVAQNRRTEVAALAKCLHRELEWIPLKAMRKERTERYRSAYGLAEDIENYLNGDPLIAGPPGTGYKLKKFVRRNRILVGGITAVLVVLVAGIAVSTIFAIGQARARAEAERATVEAQAIQKFLRGDVLGLAPMIKGREATVIDILNAAVEKLDEREFQDQPLVEASIRETLGSTYFRLGYYLTSAQERERAYHILLEQLGEEHWNTRKIMNMLAVSHTYTGNYREAVALYEKIQGDSIIHACCLAGPCARQGRYEEAERLFEETLKTAWWDPKHPHHHWALGFSWDLAKVYREQGRYKEAEELFVKTLRAQRDKYGPRGDDENALWPLIRCTNELARLYVIQNCYEKAEALFSEGIAMGDRELPGKDHPFTLRHVNGLAVLRTKQQRYEEAEALFDRAMEGRKLKLGEDHPYTLETINDLGLLRREQKRYEDAGKLLTEALEGRQLKLGPNHPHTLESKHELAVLHARQDHHQEAEKYFVMAAEGRLTKLGAAHPHTKESIKSLVDLYEALEKPEESGKWRAELAQTEAVEE